MQLRLAAIQPRIDRDPRAIESTRQAVGLLEAAANEGCDLAVLPEGYPGPLRVGDDYDPEPLLAEAAERLGIGICWSRIERDATTRWNIVAYLLGDNGERLGRYVRVHPATGDVHATLSGVGLHPGDEFVVAEFRGVGVGLLICSELWIPEVARILALRGAEVLLAPAGGGFREVTANWRLMTQARAIENQCFVAMTSHMFTGDAGAAMIAGPEAVVATSDEAEVVVGDADLERARWLRSQDDSMISPKPFTALPGLLRARRPDCYGVLTDAQPSAYDYQRPRQEPA